MIHNIRRKNFKKRSPSAHLPVEERSETRGLQDPSQQAKRAGAAPNLKSVRLNQLPHFKRSEGPPLHVVKLVNDQHLVQPLGGVRRLISGTSCRVGMRRRTFGE